MHLKQELGNMMKNGEKCSGSGMKGWLTLLHMCDGLVMMLIKAFMHVLLKSASHCDVLHLDLFY